MGCVLWCLHSASLISHIDTNSYFETRLQLMATNPSCNDRKKLFGASLLILFPWDILGQLQHQRVKSDFPQLELSFLSCKKLQTRQ